MQYTRYLCKCYILRLNFDRKCDKLHDSFQGFKNLAYLGTQILRHSAIFLEMREVMQDLSGFIPVYFIAQVKIHLNSKCNCQSFP